MPTMKAKRKKAEFASVSACCPPNLNCNLSYSLLSAIHCSIFGMTSSTSAPFAYSAATVNALSPDTLLIEGGIYAGTTSTKLLHGACPNLVFTVSSLN